MSAVPSLSLCLALFLWSDLVSADEVTVNITVEPGQSVSLPCRAPSNTEIRVVEWTKPELEPEYVLMYRNKKPDPYNQHSSYQNRVELEDREIKDGDVSMILKNVTKEDAGKYECHVRLGETNIRKRATFDTKPIKTFNLEVQSGDSEERGDEEGGVKEEGDSRGHVAGGVGLALFVAVGGVLFYKKHRGLSGQGSSKVPLDEESQPASTVNSKMEDEVLVSDSSTI